MLTDDEIDALICEWWKGRPPLTYWPRPNAMDRAIFRAGMREAARIAEEATSSAFPVAAHVAIRDAAREP